MKTSELREKTVAELKGSLLEQLKEQFSLRMQIKAGQMTRHHQLKDARRNVARLKTVLTEKQRAGN